MYIKKLLYFSLIIFGHRECFSVPGRQSLLTFKIYSFYLVTEKSTLFYLVTEKYTRFYLVKENILFFIWVQKNILFYLVTGKYTLFYLVTKIINQLNFSSRAPDNVLNYWEKQDKANRTLNNSALTK